MPTAPKQHAINWFEMAVLDFDRALRFYGVILGSSLTEISAGGTRMALFPSDPATGVGGSLTVMPGISPGLGGTIVYLNVDGEIDEVLARIPGAGGRVLRPKASIGDQGAIAIFADTEGNVVGLHSLAG